MKNNALFIGVVAGVAIVLAGCGTTRWAGHYKHGDNYPQGHHDWSANPDFPSTSSQASPVPFFAPFPTQPNEHWAAAKRYRDKANQYRREATRHIAMKAAYSVKAQDMANHCEELVGQLNAVADKLDTFAQWHEQQAGAAQK